MPIPMRVRPKPYTPPFLVTKPTKPTKTEPDTEVPISLLTKNEQHLVESVRSSYGDPLRTLERKIRHLANVLNCTEEEATHAFLHNL